MDNNKVYNLVFKKLFDNDNSLYKELSNEEITEIIISVTDNVLKVVE